MLPPLGSFSIRRARRAFGGIRHESSRSLDVESDSLRHGRTCSAYRAGNLLYAISVCGACGSWLVNGASVVDPSVLSTGSFMSSHDFTQRPISAAEWAKLRYQPCLVMAPLTACVCWVEAVTAAHVRFGGPFDAAATRTAWGAAATMGRRTRTGECSWCVYPGGTGIQ